MQKRMQILQRSTFVARIHLNSLCSWLVLTFYSPSKHLGKKWKQVVSWVRAALRAKSMWIVNNAHKRRSGLFPMPKTGCWTMCTLQNGLFLRSRPLQIAQDYHTGSKKLYSHVSLLSDFYDFAEMAKMSSKWNWDVIEIVLKMVLCSI